MRDLDDELIFESYSDEFIKVYHGGAKFHHFDAKVMKPKAGRFVSGIGINTTTNYETARKYAKGNKIVSILYLDKNIKLSENVFIPKDDIFKFLDTYIPPTKRKELKLNINHYLNRTNKTEYCANYLVNLSTSLNLSGNIGLHLNNFIVEMGADASLYPQSGGEDWLIIHNPRIIRKILHTRPSDIDINNYKLPRIKEQLL